MSSPLPHAWFRAFRCLQGLGLLGLILATAGCGGLNKNLALPRAGGPIPVSHPHEPTAEERAYWDQLAPARVIYIGETHTSNSDHAYQWEVLKGLRSRGYDVTVGWEMFESPQQSILDDWNAHRLTTDIMLDETDFQKRWGTYSVMYEKILRWTQGEGIASLALNAPDGLSHKIALGQSLEPVERGMLPTGFKPLPGGYEHFVAQMGQNPHGGADLQKFYEAQTLWDQTMAARIVEHLAKHPDGKLVVLLGRGHVEGGFGVPAYVSQKTEAAQLVVYPEGAPDEGNAKPAAGRLAALPAKNANRLLWNVRSFVKAPR